MRKGMLSGLWSLKWVLLCLLLTGCPKSDPPPPPPPPPSPEITVTGQVMLGPVVGGHSLQLVIYDTEMNELDRPTIGLDGSYGFTLKDYEGAVIAQVTSTKPQQECSVGDYIDEATAKPKCLGNNSILSSTVLKLDNTSSDNQAKLHTTPVTTIAALNAGINIKEDGTIAVNDNLSPEIIDRSNKIISQALGLGDQSVAEYTPKSIITTDQKFQSGDAYSQALAEISGIEAEGKSLNSIVKVISAGIGKNGKLSPAVQDMMVKGNQKVFKKAKEQGADTSILNQINKRQDTYPDSIAKVDLVNAPEPPVFKNKTKTKTSNQKPTWEWISGGTGNNRYQYRFGAEDDIQNVRGWTETSSSSFTSKDNLISGKYTLEIQEGHLSDPTIWSMVSSSTIEIIANQKGSVIIEGEAIQGRKLLAVTTDKDGIQGDVSYQWYRDNKTIKDANYTDYVLTENDVNTAIMVKVSYIDNIDYAERDIQSAPVNVDNIDDKPVLNKLDDVLLDEDDDKMVIALEAKDIDNDDKEIIYSVEAYDSKIADISIVTNTNNKLQITPKQNQYGEAKVTITAISNGLKDEKTFKLTINSIDDAPIFNSTLLGTTSIKLKEDSGIRTLSIAATDVDNKNTDITYGFKNSELKIAKVEVNAKNELQITPIQNMHGKTEITITANSNGMSTEKSFNLNIENTNDQPLITSSAENEAEEGKKYSYQLVVTDADKDSRAKYKLVRQQNASTMKISNEGLITWTPENKDRDYTADVTVEVDDETGTSNATNQQEFTINVKAHDDAPKIETKLDDIEVEENSEVFEIPLYTTDIDNENAAITYQATSSDNDIATVEIKNENTLNIRPVKYQYGEVKIIVTAKSNGKMVEKDFQLIIKNKNDAPNGKVTIKFSNQQHRTFVANVDNISDPDGIKGYSYQWKADNSEIMGALQSEFIPTDDEIGKRISVVVTIEDSLGNKSQFISDKTQSLKVNGIPPTVKDVTETLAQSKDSYSNIKTLLETFNYAKYIKYKSTQTPLTFVITSLPSRGVIINNDGIEITKMENGKYLEVSESFKYKRTMAGKDSFEYKGKRDNILSLKPATVNISYNNKAPHAFDFTISAAVETETRPIPFADKITDDQDLTKGIIITNNPQAGNLYIDGESFDASKLETLIDINSNVTYKSTNTSNSSDSFKYLAIDTDDERSYERKVNIEFKHDNKAPKINKEPTQTNLMIDEAGKQISFKFKITDDSSSFKAYEPLFLSTKGNTSQPLWISINTDKQSDSPVNYTVNATLNDKSYANDSIRVLIPVVDDIGLKSKYAFVINPELSVDTQNNFIQKNNTTWVDVCWQFSEKTANLDSTKITEIKQEIMNTISDSWQKNSALKFDWREDDWDAIQDGKGQLFKWDSPSNCAENYTAEYAQVKVYIKQQEEVDSIQAENRFTINLNVKANGSFEDAYPKHRIIHEFGHALGFPDENKRFDIFTGELSKKSIEPWHSWECVKSMNIQKPRVATGSDLISTTAVREISYKEWQQQPYDSYSIMDECIFDNPSVYKNSASNIQTDMLKINDKKRVQKFYGAPIIETESPHLIKDDQFFTGLFLHGSNYFYYGNGVKSSTDRFINTISLKMLFDNGILISALSSDINEDVLFKKTYDGDSPPSFISPFPSLLISCSEEQDDNTNGFRYRHADDCNSPDNLIADNKSVYYFYDNPQNIKFYSCATDPNNSSETNNCSEISGSWLVSEGVLFAKGIKNNATYFYKNY